MEAMLAVAASPASPLPDAAGVQRRRRGILRTGGAAAAAAGEPGGASDSGGVPAAATGESRRTRGASFSDGDADDRRGAVRVQFDDRANELFVFERQAPDSANRAVTDGGDGSGDGDWRPSPASRDVRSRKLAHAISDLAPRWTGGAGTAAPGSGSGGNSRYDPTRYINKPVAPISLAMARSAAVLRPSGEGSGGSGSGRGWRR